MDINKTAWINACKRVEQFRSKQISRKFTFMFTYQKNIFFTFTSVLLRHNANSTLRD